MVLRLGNYGGNPHGTEIRFDSVDCTDNPLVNYAGGAYSHSYIYNWNGWIGGSGIMLFSQFQPTGTPIMRIGADGVIHLRSTLNSATAFVFDL
jgi:hypothetical protein